MAKDAMSSTRHKSSETYLPTAEWAESRKAGAMTKNSMSGAAFASYKKFHNERLDRLEQLVGKTVVALVAMGVRESGPLHQECVLRAMKMLPGFAEREIWQAAWDAAKADNES